MTRLLCLGYGYCARRLVKLHATNFSRIDATIRRKARIAGLFKEPVTFHPLDDSSALRALHAAIREASVVLVSAAPDETGDPFHGKFSGLLAAAPGLRLVQYLSTTGIYGGHAGEWVDENTPPDPAPGRATARLKAELAWRQWGSEARKPVQIFRLSGIYGPGRSAIESLRDGTAHRRIKLGQVFNRIHVDDIAQALAAGMNDGEPGVFNVADDEPAPPQDVVTYAAGLMGVEAPPETPYDAADVTPMQASFYAGNKRCRNTLIKTRLGITLLYPTYREGLKAIADHQ